MPRVTSQGPKWVNRPKGGRSRQEEQDVAGLSPAPSHSLGPATTADPQELNWERGLIGASEWANSGANSGSSRLKITRVGSCAFSDTRGFLLFFRFDSDMVVLFF